MSRSAWSVSISRSLSRACRPMRRLVEHVEHAGEIRAELRGESDALRLAAGERLGRAIEREIAEPDVIEEFQALLDLRHDVLHDELSARIEVEVAQVGEQLRRRAARADAGSESAGLRWPVSDPASRFAVMLCRGNGASPRERCGSGARRGTPGQGWPCVRHVVGRIDAELAQPRGRDRLSRRRRRLEHPGKTRPWPRQVGHQPRGELKEKFFGSSSGNDSPVSMSVRVVENQERISPCGVSRKHAPLPSLQSGGAC